MKQKGSKMKAK